jgi:hypothetical protein
MQKGPKGQKGTIPAEFNREVQSHEVPNFLSLLGHTHSEVGWPSYNSTKLEHSL